MPNINLTFFFYIFPIILLSVAIHEFAHCWTTDRLGDDTPRRLGRVTLNPLAHLDPMGTIMMVVSSLAGFGIGWGKSSPFNPNNFRHPARDRMLTALAGPVSNIVQMLAWAALGALLIPLLLRMESGDDTWLMIVMRLSIYGVVVNASLAVFNLLPVYPLDGHHILSYFAPCSWRPIIDNPIWGMVFLFLVFSKVVGTVITPLVAVALKLTATLVGFPPPGIL